MRRLLGIALVVLAGCATLGDPAERAGDRSQIVREEVERTTHRNAYDLIEAERPHWLRPRGRTSFQHETEVVIYLDGIRAGGPDFLKQVSLITVESLRYYDAREAQFRFGTGHTQGAINVISRS
jgi:hypothetical protein